MGWEKPSSLSGPRDAEPEADDLGHVAHAHVDQLLVEEALRHAHSVRQAQHQPVLANLIDEVIIVNQFVLMAIINLKNYLIR